MSNPNNHIEAYFSFYFSLEDIAMIYLSFDKVGLVLTVERQCVPKVTTSTIKRNMLVD
jgi:hypothetical protein